MSNRRKRPAPVLPSCPRTTLETPGGPSHHLSDNPKDKDGRGVLRSDQASFSSQIESRPCCLQDSCRRETAETWVANPPAFASDLSGGHWVDRSRSAER